MDTDWASIVTPVAAALLGVVVAGVVNYWFANRRERQQRRQETDGAAVMLLAEIERIEYRLGMAIQEQFPAGPKEDFNKAFYYSLQPRLGLVFQPDTIGVLVRFYQSVEQIETLSDGYNRTGVDQDLNATRWTSFFHRAYLTHRRAVQEALMGERSDADGSKLEGD